MTPPTRNNIARRCGSSADNVRRSLDINSVNTCERCRAGGISPDEIALNGGSTDLLEDENTGTRARGTLPGGVPGVAVRPPMSVFVPPLRKTAFAGARALVPVTSRPMKFPCTRLPSPLLTSTPLKPPLPAMMLRAATLVPPITLLLERTSIAVPVCVIAFPPVTSVPMKFPSTTLPVPLRMTIPVALPEMRFRAAAVVPPIRVPETLKPKSQLTPWPFALALVPVESVPRKHPSTITLLA
jgi:hypothetical protein